MTGSEIIHRAGEAFRGEDGPICPPGSSVNFRVQPLSKIFSAFAVGQIIFINSAVPSHTEGRLAIVTDAGRDAVDLDGAFDEWR